MQRRLVHKSSISIERNAAGFLQSALFVAFLGLTGLLSSFAIGQAEPAFVGRNNNQGQGLLVLHRANCFLVLPRHVHFPSALVDIATAAPIATGRAEIIPRRTINDLSVARVDDTFAPRCTEEWTSISSDIAGVLEGALRNGTTAFLTRVAPSGEQSTVPMRLTSFDDDFIFAETMDRGEIFQGTSGGFLRIDGSVIGMAVESPDESAAQFLRADLIRSELDRTLNSQVESAQQKSRDADFERSSREATIDAERSERALEDGRHLEAASLAVAAMDKVRSQDSSLRGRLAKVIYRSLLQLRPPAIDIPLAGFNVGADGRDPSSYSFDGRYFAYLKDDNSFNIYSLGTATPFRSFRPKKPIANSFFSADGRRLFIIDTSRELGVLFMDDPQSEMVMLGKIGDAAQFGFPISFDGSLFFDITGKTLTVRSTANPTKAVPIPISSKLARPTFSFDGRMLAAVFENYTFTVWSTDTGKPLFSGKLKGTDYASPEFSRDGSRMLLNYDMAGAPWVIDTSTWETLPELGRKDRGSVSASAFLTDDGSMVASAMKDGSIAIWNSADGAVERQITSAGRLYWLGVAGGGEILFGQASSDTPMKAWQWRTGEQVAALKEDWDNGTYPMMLDSRPALLLVRKNRLQSVELAPSDAIIRLHADIQKFSKMAVTNNGTRVVTSTDDTVFLWNAKTGKLIETVRATIPGIQAVLWALSPDGQRLLVGPPSEETGEIRIFDTATGKQTGSLPDSGLPTLGFSVSEIDPTFYYQTGLQSFSIGKMSDGIVANINYYTRDFIETEKGTQHPVVRIAVADAGGTISVAELRESEIHRVGAITSPGARYGDVILDSRGEIMFSAGDDKFVRVHRLDDGVELGKLRIDAGIDTVIWDRDRTHPILIMDQDGTVTEWYWAEGRIIKTATDKPCGSRQLQGTLRMCSVAGNGPTLGVVGRGVIDIADFAYDADLVSDGKFVRVTEEGITQLFPTYPSFEAMMVAARETVAKLNR